MAIELKQQLRLTQQLVMTPQLQQAIKLLQLSRLELVSTVQQELEENPVLEEAFDEELAEEGAREAAPAEATEVAAQSERESSAELPESDPVPDMDWATYGEGSASPGPGIVRDEEERPGVDGVATRRPTLQEHLEWQLQLSVLSADEREAAGWILGNLDDDGYLRSTLEEIARQAGVSEELAAAALTKVQALDPPGVAARDLRECLLLQLDTLGVHDGLVRRMVDSHLPQLEKRDLRGIARDLDVTLEAVAVAADLVAQLEPRPGRPFGGDEPIYIVPDIYLHKLGDDYHIVMNDDGLPKLRINRLYRDVLAKSRDVGKETRDYVQDRVRSALWLIKSIHQRQRTIYRVMESIVRHQREFFDKGIAHLKPLNLRDVADDIGMHESTVSRVTTNKYTHTPQGIFELKYFFNSSISRVDGDAIASESVKEKIRQLIAHEDARRPLSDQRLAEMLIASNIDIARRTVTKYREAMNILSSTKRRRVGS
jgi:RNA polymerase sigma-54 factor